MRMVRSEPLLLLFFCDLVGFWMLLEVRMVCFSSRGREETWIGGEVGFWCCRLRFSWVFGSDVSIFYLNFVCVIVVFISWLFFSLFSDLGFIIWLFSDFVFCRLFILWFLFFHVFIFWFVFVVYFVTNSFICNVLVPLQKMLNFRQLIIEGLLDFVHLQKLLSV